MKNHTLPFTFAFLLFALSMPAQSLFDQLSGRDVLDITLEASLSNLRDSDQNKEYLPAKFSYQDRNGSQQLFEIKVKARGKYRRMVCDFPPLKLNFDKDELKKRGWATYDKFKLVTHCLDEERASADNVLSEYLAYKMYQTLSDQSYRVQLVRITYKDVNAQEPSEIRWGFLIEPTAELEDRMEAVECEDCYGLSKEDLQAENNVRLHLFQYMIGNEDWAIDKLRNVKLFLFPGSEKLVAVPYDFDFAGLVDAGYAVPRGELGLVDVEQRAYLGELPAKDDLARTFASFEANRSTIESLIRDFGWMQESQHKHVQKYVNRFYEKAYPRLFKKAPIGNITIREEAQAAFSASDQ